jgi:hypothetical protein
MRPITLNTSNAGGGAITTPPCPLDLYISPFNVTLQAIVTGTVSYDVQYTKDDVFAVGYVPSTGQWTSITAMTAATTSVEATLISPVTAVRLVQNSGSGSVRLRILQAGLT